MPIYEYQCDTCAKTVEILLRRSDEQPVCPNCAGQKLDRVLSIPAAPSVRGGTTSRSSASLPMAGGEGCGAPRCCGGGCQF